MEERGDKKKNTRKWKNMAKAGPPGFSRARARARESHNEHFVISTPVDGVPPAYQCTSPGSLINIPNLSETRENDISSRKLVEFTRRARCHIGLLLHVADKKIFLARKLIGKLMCS